MSIDDATLKVGNHVIDGLSLTQVDDFVARFQVIDPTGPVLLSYSVQSKSQVAGWLPLPWRSPARLIEPLPHGLEIEDFKADDFNQRRTRR